MPVVEAVFPMITGCLAIRPTSRPPSNPDSTARIKASMVSRDGSTPDGEKQGCFKSRIDANRLVRAIQAT
jgi:hypothetical protein